MGVVNRPILLVEDSDVDFDTTVRVLRKMMLPNPIYRCADGDEALDYLFRRGAYAEAGSAPRPGLILLDLNLPGTDGREVLAEIKADADLRTIPVVVLTTSAAGRDVQGCYAAGANSYIQKRINLTEFTRALEMLRHYWFDVVLLPGDQGGP